MQRGPSHSDATGRLRRLVRPAVTQGGRKRVRTSYAERQNLTMRMSMPRGYIAGPRGCMAGRLGETKPNSHANTRHNGIESHVGLMMSADLTVRVAEHACDLVLQSEPKCAGRV